MCRLEVREPDFDAVIVDAMAQHVDRAALVDLLRETIGELGLSASLATMDRDESLPRCRLRLDDEREELGCVETSDGIEVADPFGVGAPFAQPIAAALDERSGDRVFEAALRNGHAATPAIPSWPVIATVTRACRRSSRRATCRSKRRTPSTRRVLIATPRSTTRRC